MYVAVMRSGSIVDRKVCSSRGREKGPGMKFRAAGSEEGGGWCGWQGAAVVFGRAEAVSTTFILIWLVGSTEVVGVWCVYRLGGSCLLRFRAWAAGSKAESLSDVCG